MKVTELASNWANATGADTTNEEVKTFFDKLSSVDLELPPSLAEAFEKNITTRARALRDPEIVGAISSDRDKEYRGTIQAMLPSNGFEPDEITPVFESDGKPHDVATIFANAFTAIKAKAELHSNASESDKMKLLKVETSAQVAEAKRALLQMEAAMKQMENKHERDLTATKIENGFKEIGVSLTPKSLGYAVEDAMKQIEQHGYQITKGEAGLELWQKTETGGLRKATKSDNSVLSYVDFLRETASQFNQQPKSNLPVQPTVTTAATDTTSTPVVRRAATYPSGPTPLEKAAFAHR